MKFRNYCVVILGNTEGAQREINEISEGKPNVLEAKGILISTFTSVVNPNEITTWFTDNKRNFLLFDLNKESSGFNFMKPEINKELFSFLDNVDTREMDNKLLNTIGLSGETTPVFTKLKNRTLKENKLDINLINKMSISEKEILLNELIEFGLEKLSDSDRKLLYLLVN